MNDIIETETPVMVSPRWDMLLDAGEDTSPSVQTKIDAEVPSRREPVHVQQRLALHAHHRMRDDHLRVSLTDALDGRAALGARSVRSASGPARRSGEGDATSRAPRPSSRCCRRPGCANGARRRGPMPDRSPS